MLSQNANAAVSETVQVRIPILKETAGGWIIDLCDSAGNHILSSAIYPSKFLAEEALERLRKAN